MECDGVGEDDDDEQWWTHVPEETLQVALTLDQTVWWVDSESTPHLVDAMSSTHRDAVIDYLVLRARVLLLAVQETAARARAGSAAGRAAQSLLGAGVQLEDCDDWLESTSLMGRLRALAGHEF